MKIVAVTRVLNEDDILEAFARHHAAHVDHHIFLDNGSSDRSLAILRSLHDIGFPITLLRSRAVIFNETGYNAFLLRYAVQQFEADWVLFLDCDEFLDLRDSEASLREHLRLVPPEIMALKLELANYHQSPSDSSDEMLVPRRLTQRDRTGTGVHKVVVRGSLSGQPAVVSAGNHEVLLNGEPVPSRVEAQIRLAHYFRRSAWQVITKTLTGRLKVLAAGQQELQHNTASHYVDFFETMRDAPERLLADENFMRGPVQGLDLVTDPIAYNGGMLTFTQRSDDRLKAIRNLMHLAEALAAQHGRLMDGNEAIRAQVDRWNATVERFF